jgi:hypothetical protein
MKCAECGQEVGKLFCAKCRARKEKVNADLNFGSLIPLLFWDRNKKLYVFGCTVALCPYNRNGLCASLSVKLPVQQFHEFDGDNIIQRGCG